MSAHKSADALVNTPPTHHWHYQRIGRHTIDASTDTLPMPWSVNITDVLVNTTDTWSKFFLFLTIILLLLYAGSTNNFIRKDKDTIAK